MYKIFQISQTFSFFTGDNMAQKHRQDAIVRILKKQKFATVKSLISTLNYSSATINRDLNALEKLKIVTRSYGGVELVEKTVPPLPYRYDYMKKEKRHIGREGAKFVENGDTIFISASTTTEYLAPFLAEKKDITVITHDVKLTMMLSEDGVNVICLGGKVLEAPTMLAGTETVENAQKYHADKMFISVGNVSQDGIIGTVEPYYLIYKTMMKNSKEIYFLADRKKISDKISVELCDFSKITAVISDFDFPESTKSKYFDTKFICVKN